MAITVVCRFCLQQVEIDGSKAQRERHRSLATFKCCQIHLKEKIVFGEWYYSQETPSPFCKDCNKLSENLWTLEEQFRQAKTALEIYIVTLTNDILQMRERSEANNKSKTVEALTFVEPKNFGKIESPVTDTPFINDLEDDYYDDELLVEDIKIKQELEEGLSDDYFEIYDPGAYYDNDREGKATLKNNSFGDGGSNDLIDNKKKPHRELRIYLERLKLDSEGKILLPEYPDSKVRIRRQRKAAIKAKSAIRYITPDNFEECEPKYENDEDFSAASDTRLGEDEDIICVTGDKPFRRTREKGRFICIICEVICKSKTGYKRHVKIHKGPFDCTICEIAYDSLFAFTHHMKIHSEGKLYKCDECEQSFAFKASLASHKKSHQRAKLVVPYSCYVCKESFTERNSLINHNKTVHKNDVYKCDSCEEIFNLFSKFQKHKIEVHGLPSPYDCPICQAVFKNTRCLRKHLRLIHGTGVKGQEEASVCDICGKKYPRRDRMLEHRREVHFKNPNKAKRDRRNREINRGRPTIIRKKPGRRLPAGKGMYPCPNCEKTFSRYDTLENHINVIHTKQVTFDCKLCGKKLASSSTLKAHMNDHLMTKVFKCEFCDRIFSQNYNRRSHIRRIHVQNKAPRKPYKRIALIQAPISSSENAPNPDSINLQQTLEKEESILTTIPCESLTTIPCETSNATVSNDPPSFTSTN